MGPNWEEGVGRCSTIVSRFGARWSVTQHVSGPSHHIRIRCRGMGKCGNRRAPTVVDIRKLAKIYHEQVTLKYAMLSTYLWHGTRGAPAGIDAHGTGLKYVL
jgi:hypothetical protein